MADTAQVIERGAEQTSALKISALNKTYKDVCALKSVSLDIKPGVTALLGQNGAGKTTLIKCALGLEAPDSGSVRVFGEAPAKRTARERIGVMLQDTELPDLLTGRELIELFASYYTRPISTDAVVELAHIENFADKRYGGLSGGQKRRIQFALAIVGNPDLVFLDEPTTGLDTDARKGLWEVVRSFASAGRSIILCTHYLEEADALADRVVILAAGEVIADARAEELRNSIAGALIRCQTNLDAADIKSLPACEGVTLADRVAEIRTSNAATTLRAMLQRDADVQNLTVANPKLEDIFEGLTK